MKKNKILFVNPYESSLFSFRKELLDSLIDCGYEIVLCINSTERIEKEYTKKVSKIIDVRMSLKDKNPFSNLRLKKQYRQIIKEEKPDIILSFGFKPNIYCGMASKNVPIVANITGLGNLFSKKGFLFRIGLFLYRKAFKKVDYVLFQNEDEKKFFDDNKISIHRYQIIPGSGVNTEVFVPGDEAKIFASDIRFLFASRALPQKGYDLLLRAIPIVLSSNDHCHFTIVSAEEDIFSDKRLMDLVNKSNSNVSVINRVNDMARLYRDHHFIVAPSFYREGISNILLESLSCGRPIITTKDNPGCKEVLVDGENGFGVISNDLDSLVNALNKAASLDKNQIFKMGSKGRKMVIEKFDRSIVIKIYQNVIKELCKI